MIPDLDIYRSAQVLVKKHGQDAPTHVTHAQAFDALADPSQGLSNRNFCKKYFLGN